MDNQSTYLPLLLTKILTKNFTKICVLTFCVLFLVWFPYFSFPIYPDEVAYQLLTGRWFQEGFSPIGLNGICHPKGVEIPPIFWTATILTSIIQSLIYSFKAERIYPMILMGVVFAATTGYLAQRIRLNYLAFLPVSIAAFGMMPAQIQLLRPEFIWIILALTLFICSLLRGWKSTKNLTILSIFLFYIGCYLHPEFIFLFPAILLNFIREKTNLYIKLSVITLVLCFVVSSLIYIQELSKCSELPSYQSAISALSTPIFSWSFLEHSISNVLFPMKMADISSGVRTAHVLPDFKMYEGFVNVNIYYTFTLLAAFIIGLIISFVIIFKSILRRSRLFCEQSFKSKLSGNKFYNAIITSNISKIFLRDEFNRSVLSENFNLDNKIDLTLISLLYLAAFLLAFLDPNHVFYRNLVFFIICSFCLVIYIDHILLIFRIVKTPNYRISVAILLLPVIMALLSTFYSFGYVLPEITNGYSGPSVPLKVWHKPIDSKTSSLVYSTLQKASASYERVIADDYTYKFVRSRYKQIFPITYLGLSITGGVSKNVIMSKLNGIPIIVDCEYKSVLPFKLLSDALPIPDYRDICIGIIDASLVSSQLTN
jgi:hypothetical protein